MRNSNELLREQYEDAALALLMNEYAQQEGERLLQEFETAKAAGNAPGIPAELDQKCQKMIRLAYQGQRRKRLAKKLFRTVGRGVVTMLVILGIFTALVFSVEAVRIPVINYMIELGDGYMSITRDDDDDTRIFDPSDPLAGLIPDSYWVERYIDLNSGSTALYRNAAGDTITLMTRSTGANTTIDTENTVHSRELTICGCEALFTKADTTSLIWFAPDGQYLYTLLASALTEEEMIDAAEGYTLRISTATTVPTKTTSADRMDIPMDSFVPEDYGLYNESRRPHSYLRIYKNEAGNTISFSALKRDGTLNVDTEDATVEIVDISGYQGFLIQKATAISVLWFDNELDLICKLTATAMDYDVFWPMAEQIAGANIHESLTQ